MVKPRLRRPSPVYLHIPSQQEQFSQPLSAFENGRTLNLSYSRPCNGALLSPSQSPRSAAMANRPPTLTEILLDVSPPPWTLSAFMAYLSQNHCMESLEFTLDSQRYAAFYDQLLTEIPPSPESKARVCDWWNKLMQVYIVPCAPREVNIPAHVRDQLLKLPSGPFPPRPTELEEAGRIIYELMNDSLLVPFLQSVAPLSHGCQSDASIQHHRRGSQNAGSFTEHSGRPVASPHSADFDSLTDDSDSNPPSAAEPMTPPTTPPTSEYTFNTSPGGFQRAMAAHNKGWKKVGEKLGLSRKAPSRRSTPTSSSAPEFDTSMSDHYHS
ncbi:regulator of G-protein signaling [Moelleriella libera RCEF 2490]|uniref:Regulator of G-protein signaling n=1 Tax=Moelleriella libera RCEF 2490 TaxID=1081109 RepID=A0A168B6V6_9HYPO|nr:regulator of G-protein signaling [Moelleriella libera RCEF 2490]